MKNLRHATRKKNRNQFSPPEFASSAQVLAKKWLGKLTRLQIILLSAAACSIVLGVTSSIKQETTSSDRQLHQAMIDNPASQSSKSSGQRKAIALDLFPADKHQNSIHAIDNTSIKQDQEYSAVIERPTVDIATAEENSTKTIARVVKSGDNLSNLFTSVGLSAKDVYQITQSGKEGKSLTRMFPGEALQFVFDADQALVRITRQKSALESIHFTPTDSRKGFITERILREPEIKQVHRSGTVAHSLALAASKSGLSPSLTMNMANIFGGVIDFVYDVRAGDRFTVVFEEHFLDGEKIDEGNIIAAQYVNRGKTYNALRYVHNSGEIGYYNEEGVSMRKAFLRSPLDFTRVSSGFNLKRLHPITKQIKPHRGIDYAAPRGTPVFSVGEGRVLASGYSNANGKYVFIKHGEAYTTKYLHLSRRTVKKGQRVKQGQIIGHVGCTGLCTGPHLHYEFLVNGVHRNPRTIVKKLPKAKRLAQSELSAFSKATTDSRQVLQHFSNRYQSQFELASNE